MTVPPEIIGVLEPGYDLLFDRAVSVFERDDRVRALWLSGSLGRGDADAMSDLDLLVAVTDDGLPAFAESWREWLGDITPTLIPSTGVPVGAKRATMSSCRFMSSPAVRRFQDREGTTSVAGRAILSTLMRRRRQKSFRLLPAHPVDPWLPSPP